MCGTYGKIHFELDKSVLQDEIFRKTELIQHRGPDDNGYYLIKMLVNAIGD